MLLGESYIKFYVELEENFVPDNNFGAKLFEYLDLNINYEDVSFKSSPNDYDVTSFINDKMFRNMAYLKRVPFEGQFDAKNYDSSELKNSSATVTNRRGLPFTKKVNENGADVEKNYYRYELLLPINHGLCKGQILPAGVHINLTFHRAKASKGMFFAL